MILVCYEAFWELPFCFYCMHYQEEGIEVIVHSWYTNVDIDLENFALTSSVYLTHNAYPVPLY